jgi:glycosyltransferase involved in cell wall biosynthesis
MRIGIDASRAARTDHTGTETYSWHLIRALLEARGADQTILYSPSDLPSAMWTDHAASSHCEVRIIPFPRLWTHLRLNWELRRDPPQLLFVPSHVMPVGCPVPAVVTVHDLGYRYYPTAHRALDRWYLDWTTRRHARRAAYVIADSEATRDDLCRYYGADRNRVRVVYPGRDEALLRVSDPAALAAIRARCGIHAEYVLFLGTLQPRKNLSRLLEAFASLDAPEPASPQLVLAGKPGWLHENLRAQVHRLGLSDRVVFAGYVPPTDKAALLSGALALAFPSLYEGFGMPVLEAMACGVPVLTSNVSSLPEVAGNAALLVNPLDTQAIAAGLSRVVNDAPLRHSLVERGYAQVRRFSWRRAAEQLWEVFDSLAE